MHKEKGEGEGGGVRGERLDVQSRAHTHTQS